MTLRIRFDKIDGFIKTYNGIRYLALFGHTQYDEICDRVKYLINKKGSMTDSINHNFASIRTDSSLILYLLKKY